jgi:16S rRNA C967 or C1407 C5-methylase (RsmB/RsmF family)
MSKSELAFVAYYSSQKLVSDDEFEKWLETLKTPLPITFRLSPIGDTKRLQREIKTELRGVDALTFLPNLYQLPLGCTRSILRYAKADSELGRIRKWCKRESGRGITWQEAVSLIPAALLAPNPDHILLDMCAVRSTHPNI